MVHLGLNDHIYDLFVGVMDVSGDVKLINSIRIGNITVSYNTRYQKYRQYTEYDIQALVEEKRSGNPLKGMEPLNPLSHRRTVIRICSFTWFSLSFSHITVNLCLYFWRR